MRHPSRSAASIAGLFGVLAWLAIFGIYLAVHELSDEFLGQLTSACSQRHTKLVTRPTHPTQHTRYCAAGLYPLLCPAGTERSLEALYLYLVCIFLALSVLVGLHIYALDVWLQNFIAIEALVYYAMVKVLVLAGAVPVQQVAVVSSSDRDDRRFLIGADIHTVAILYLYVQSLVFKQRLRAGWWTLPVGLLAVGHVVCGDLSSFGAGTVRTLYRAGAAACLITAVIIIALVMRRASGSLSADERMPKLLMLAAAVVVVLPSAVRLLLDTAFRSANWRNTLLFISLLEVVHRLVLAYGLPTLSTWGEQSVNAAKRVQQARADKEALLRKVILWSFHQVRTPQTVAQLSLQDATATLAAMKHGHVDQKQAIADVQYAAVTALKANWAITQVLNAMQQLDLLLVPGGVRSMQEPVNVPSLYYALLDKWRPAFQRHGVTLISRAPMSWATVVDLAQCGPGRSLQEAGAAAPARTPTHRPLGPESQSPKAARARCMCVRAYRRWTQKSAPPVSPGSTHGTQLTACAADNACISRTQWWQLPASMEAELHDPWPLCRIQQNRAGQRTLIGLPPPPPDDVALQHLDSRDADQALWQLIDIQALIQALDTSLANAVKYTPRGGRVIVELVETAEPMVLNDSIVPQTASPQHAPRQGAAHSQRSSTHAQPHLRSRNQARRSTRHSRIRSRTRLSSHHGMPLGQGWVPRRWEQHAKAGDWLGANGQVVRSESEQRVSIGGQPAMHSKTPDTTTGNLTPMSHMRFDPAAEAAESATKPADSPRYFASRCWQVRVMDTGPGISEAQRDQFLRPFARLAPANEGAGLSLMVASQRLRVAGYQMNLRSPAIGCDQALTTDLQSSSDSDAFGCACGAHGTEMTIVFSGVDCPRAQSAVDAMFTHLMNSLRPGSLQSSEEEDEAATPPSHTAPVHSESTIEPPARGSAPVCQLDYSAPTPSDALPSVNELYPTRPGPVPHAGRAPFRFPSCVVPLPPQIGPNFAGRAAPRLGSHAAQLPDPLRLLLVDDMSTILKVLARAIKKRVPHASITYAANGADAVAAVRACEAHEPFHAISMDVIMPIMDGFEATSRIRALGYRGLIVGATANAVPEDRAKLLACGASTVMHKPLDIDALLGWIAAHLADEGWQPAASAQAADTPLVHGIQENSTLSSDTAAGVVQSSTETGNVASQVRA